MSRASAILLDRSTRYLLDAGQLVSPGRREGGEVDEELGRVVLREVNRVMKFALDAGDLATFAELEQRSQAIPDEGEEWAEPEESPARRLADYRRVLAFGLAMWSAHLLRRRSTEAEYSAESVPAEALRLLAGRYAGIEDVFEVYEDASKRDDEERVPWTTWFLSELPAGEAHMIPTEGELLFIALLLALVWTRPTEPTVVQPREWMRWHEDDVEAALSEFETEAERWGPILGIFSSGSETPLAASGEVEDWRLRIAHLRDLIAGGRAKREEARRAGIREAPLDPAKVAELEAGIRTNILERRVIRHLFATQGGLQRLGSPPAARRELSSRHWIPKSLLAEGSNVLGLGVAARQLAQAPVNGEVERLLGALPERELVPVVDEDALTRILTRELERMREAGTTPTLILLPISWHLRQALGLGPIGPGTAASENPLIPAVIARHLAGSFDGVPVLAAPQVPSRQLWALDLHAVASFLEWSSQQQSGVRIEVEVFSASEARKLIAERPEIGGDDDPDEVTVTVTESVLLTQHVCWLIEAGSPAAATPIEVPEALALDK